MLILRRLAPFVQSVHSTKRFYARKTVTTFNADMKQVHQETLRYVSPYANIKIDSDIYVKVNSIDPHKYPNGDAFIVELHGGPVKNCTASMEVKVSGDNDENVEVFLKKLTDSTDFHCELAIPIKAALNVTSRHAAIVQNIFGNELKVKATKSINAKNIKAENIELLSSGGDINCQGILLGKETIVKTENKGNIVLDKLQGDSITCKTTEGNITTNCSYVELSKFETNTGCLDLKNVHKKTSVYVHEKGELKMTGVHGSLNVFVNEGTMNLQLSELEGDNTVQANNLTTSVINISDDIESNTSVEIMVAGDAAETYITLDKTLEHLTPALNENRQHFKWPLEKESKNKLTVSSKSSLTVGKSSWMNMMSLKMAEKQAVKE